MRSSAPRTITGLSCPLWSQHPCCRGKTCRVGSLRLPLSATIISSHQMSLITNCYTDEQHTSTLALCLLDASCADFAVSSFAVLKNKLQCHVDLFSRFNVETENRKSRFAIMRTSIEKEMTMQVEGGWLDGSFIRRVRKPGKCEYWRGKSSGGFCRKPLNVGDLYVEGEHTDTSNPWQMDRYCVECAGPEAVATVNKWRAEAA